MRALTTTLAVCIFLLAGACTIPAYAQEHSMQSQSIPVPDSYLSVHSGDGGLTISVSGPSQLTELIHILDTNGTIIKTCTLIVYDINWVPIEVPGIYIVKLVSTGESKRGIVS